MANEAFPLSKVAVQVRQARPLCASLTTDWDSNGPYSSSVYFVAYPCPYTTTPLFPSTVTTTQGVLRNLPSPPVPTPSATTSASVVSSPGAASNTWPPAAIAVAVALGVGFALLVAGIVVAVVAALFLNSRRRARETETGESESTDGPSTVGPQGEGRGPGRRCGGVGFRSERAPLGPSPSHSGSSAKSQLANLAEPSAAPPAEPPVEAQAETPVIPPAAPPAIPRRSAKRVGFERIPQEGALPPA